VASGARSLPAPFPAAHRGQALVLVTPLLLVLAVAMLWVFDAGHAVAEKRRLTDAADAAAFGAATWQARALNFSAYVNRAIVANEVAIAQSVSLRSWSAYMSQLLANGAVASRWLPVLNVATATLERIWSGFDAGLQPGLAATEGAISFADHELAAAQRLVHAAAFEFVPEVVRSTLAANDPAFVLSAGGEALLARWAGEWAAFTSSYGGAWRWRQADVVDRSLDGFTASRGRTIAPPLVGSVLRVERRGGTERSDFETWRAMDTLSLHTRSGILVGRMREQLPLAWGAAMNGELPRVPGSFGGSIRTNPRASRLAEGMQRRPRSYLGLPSLRDLSVAQRREFAPPRIVVRAVLPGGSRRRGASLLGITAVASAARAGEGQGLELASGGVYAAAAADTPFRRPARRRDGAIELPSLYAPYWMATLAPVPAADRVLGAALDRVPLLAAVPSP
jgi:hypothetical protein